MFANPASVSKYRNLKNPADRGVGDVETASLGDQSVLDEGHRDQNDQDNDRDGGQPAEDPAVGLDQASSLFGIAGADRIG
jgi:hypothetical protein